MPGPSMRYACAPCCSAPILPASCVSWFQLIESAKAFRQKAQCACGYQYGSSRPGMCEATDHEERQSIKYLALLN